jgi:hypothetical protein
MVGISVFQMGSWNWNRKTSDWEHLSFHIGIVNLFPHAASAFISVNQRLKKAVFAQGGSS